MIAIVDYGLGNVRSVQNMLMRAGTDAVITEKYSVLRAASRLILPGVGHFGFAMQALQDRGLVAPLHELVVQCGVPILGICLGAQLLGRRSDEADCAGLGWLPMETVAFDRSKLLKRERVPHMGWAETHHSGSRLFEGVEQPPRFYYVHSYHFRSEDPAAVTCTAVHGYRFAAGVARGHIMGVQFHPEKSHAYGQRLLANFATMTFAV